MLATAYVGLGSNLGDRERYLRSATESIRQLKGCWVGRQAGIVESAPMDAEGGPFLNSVVEVFTFLPPLTLLNELLKIEKHQGRSRGSRPIGKLHEARTMDLDLLWYSGIVLARPNLVLPHPRIRERRFVLEPLVEIAPNLLDPLSSRPYRDFLP